jgi:hypothetical protein
VPADDAPKATLVIRACEDLELAREASGLLETRGCAGARAVPGEGFEPR